MAEDFARFMTPALKQRQARLDAEKAAESDPEQRALDSRYVLQRSGRGLADAIFGIPDLINTGLNAGIRDAGYYAGYKPDEVFQFPMASQSAANLATEATGADIVRPEEVSPGARFKGGAAELGIGMLMPGPGGKARTAEKLTDLVGDVSRETKLTNLPNVDASLGDLDNPAAMFEGVSPHDFTPEQWSRFGDTYGVPNLGPSSTLEWTNNLQPVKTISGRDITVPGGEGGFTYYDLLHLKQQGINPNDLPPELHQQIHDRMVSAVSPKEDMQPHELFNRFAFAQVSPNQPLTPNELAQARLMAKGPEDLQRFADMVPWKHDAAQDVTKEMRDEISSKIANQLGLGAGKGGGLGARGTADYTRISETAQRMLQDPEFFRFRGAGEMGADDATNWANYVERISGQTPGLSNKTGSFGVALTNPKDAGVSAVDRHMANQLSRSMFDSDEDFGAFTSKALLDYAKQTGKTPADWDSLPASFRNDRLFGYLNANPAMKYRTAKGDVNPRVPEHLLPENAKWVSEPSSIEVMSAPYKKVLAAEAERAGERGQSTFASQWMHWDKIRNRLEPHEILFPGLERLPRMSMDQMRNARTDLSQAGYMSGSKTDDGLTPVRQLPSASRASYFSIPLGAALLPEIFRQLEEERGGNNAL